MRTTKKRRTLPIDNTRVSPFSEFVDFHGLMLLFGLRRQTAYHLLNTEPGLRDASISLKGRGESRGKRLFHVAKFRAFLEGKMKGAA